MAKVTAPLLSFGARGQIAKTTVYATWRGVQYARRHVIPANPKTAGQTTTRTTFATLREMWKLLGPIGRAPWDTFASGRKFLGLNAFIGENMRVVRGDGDFQDFIGSPGARGGLPPVSVVVSTGALLGEIDVLITAPTLPADWTITAGQAVGFPDQDPIVDFGGPFVEAEDVVDPFDLTLAGFASAESVVAAGWLKWVKPNGQTAYSVGISGVAVAGA